MATNEHTLDFGPINRDEFVLVDAVGSAHAPEELAGEGYTVSIRDGHRIWHYEVGGLTVLIRGEVVGATTDAAVSFPLRILERAFHTTAPCPLARLEVRNGWCTLGLEHDLVTARVGVGAPLEIPSESFTTRCLIEIGALLAMLETMTSYPHHTGDRPSDWPVGELIVRKEHIEGRAPWSVAGGSDVIDRAPAEGSGPEVSFTASMWSLHRVRAILRSLSDTPFEEQLTSWTIDVGHETGEVMRVSSHIVEIFVPRQLTAAEQVMLEAAKAIDESLGAETVFSQGSTVETSIDGETVVGDTTFNSCLNVRFSVPVCQVDTSHPTPILAEVNGYNERRSTSTAYVADGSVHVRHTMPVCEGLVKAIPSVVRSLVKDAKWLRENIALASSFGESDE